MFLAKPKVLQRLSHRSTTCCLKCNLAGFDLSGATKQVRQILNNLDSSIQWEFAGQSKEMSASLRSMQFALALAIFLVYVIMASAFESILHPFVILFSVPLAIVGVIAGLWVLQMPISVISLIGQCACWCGREQRHCARRYDHRKRNNGWKNTAISEAAKLRLRPIAITIPKLCWDRCLWRWVMVKVLRFNNVGMDNRWSIIVNTLTLIVIPIVYQILTNIFERTAVEGHKHEMLLDFLEKPVWSAGSLWHFVTLGPLHGHGFRNIPFILLGVVIVDLGTHRMHNPESQRRKFFYPLKTEYRILKD